LVKKEGPWLTTAGSNTADRVHYSGIWEALLLTRAAVTGECLYAIGKANSTLNTLLYLAAEKVDLPIKIRRYEPIVLTDLYRKR